MKGIRPKEAQLALSWWSNRKVNMKEVRWQLRNFRETTESIVGLYRIFNEVDFAEPGFIVLD